MKSATTRLLALAFVLSVGPQGAAAQKVHEILPAPDHIHYGYSEASVKPALTIDSGDIVQLRTATGTPKYCEELASPGRRFSRNFSPPSQA